MLHSCFNNDGSFPEKKKNEITTPIYQKCIIDQLQQQKIDWKKIKMMKDVEFDAINIIS